MGVAASGLGYGQEISKQEKRVSRNIIGMRCSTLPSNNNYN